MELTRYEQGLCERWVHHKEFTIIGRKTTVCLLVLHNGFEVVGTSACVNPDDFDLLIGEHYALKDALAALDRFHGFYLHQEVEKESDFDE